MDESRELMNSILGQFLVGPEGIPEELNPDFFRNPRDRQLFSKYLLNGINDASVIAESEMGNGSKITATYLSGLLDAAMKIDSNKINQYINQIVVIRKNSEEGLTDLGNARRFSRRLGSEVRYCHQRRRWLFYNGVRWEFDESGEIERRAKDVIRGIYEEASQFGDEDRRKEYARHAIRSESAQKIRAMISLAESEPGISIRQDEFDCNPFLLNVANGTIDLKTGELHPHNPDDLIIKLAPVEFDSAVLCPRWIQFVSEIYECNQSLIDFSRRAIGYSLTGDTREQCLFINHGRGANGKSTMLSIYQKLLGDYAQQTPSETLLVKRMPGINNDIARLRKSRIVMALEVEEGRRLAESLVKGMTGQDKMVARHLYSEFFEFEPEFKLWIGTNHKPQIRGTDHAIWRRIRLVPFNRIFKDEEQDKELIIKLESELSGILNWAIEGCLQWQRDGLGMPEEIQSAVDEYREESDPLGSFLSDCITTDGEASIKASTLYQKYKEWAEEAGEKIITGTALGRAVVERGIDKTRLSDGNYYIGIRFRGNHV
ncbi:MAG: hypothetical protein KKF00_04255 [Proteobacteria bacterium]|nr:hypothetical protein [Pseudomonadota bacterium]